MTTSIYSRPYDFALVCWFAFALYFALMMDVLNALAPTGPITRQILDGMSWPPFFMRDLFEWWTFNADKVLYENPQWYQLLCGFSPVVYAPFYCIAIYAFIHEKEWIRVPCLVWAGMLLGSLPGVFVAELTYDAAEGEPATQPMGKLMFLAGYGSFLIVPALVIYRMWDGAFTHSAASKPSNTAVEVNDSDAAPTPGSNGASNGISNGSGSRPRANSRARSAGLRRRATARTS